MMLALLNSLVGSFFGQKQHKSLLAPTYFYTGFFKHPSQNQQQWQGPNSLLAKNALQTTVGNTFHILSYPRLAVTPGNAQLPLSYSLLSLFEG